MTPWIDLVPIAEVHDKGWLSVWPSRAVATNDSRPIHAPRVLDCSTSPWTLPPSTVEWFR